MAGFETHLSSERVTTIVMGDSGSGKTSLIGTLANAGFNVRIIDFDNGLDILNSVLTEGGKARTSFISLRDPTEGRAEAMMTAKKLILGGWKDGDEDLGKLSDWTMNDVLVIDSGTFMGSAAKKAALTLTGSRNLYEALTQPQWGEALRQVENVLDYITQPHLPFNVVMTCLPIPVDDDMERTKVYPYCVTKNFSMNVLPGYFNNMVAIKSRRDGSRVIQTVSDLRMDLKVTRPDMVPAAIEPDLAKLFGALRGDTQEWEDIKPKRAS